MLNLLSLSGMGTSSLQSAAIGSIYYFPLTSDASLTANGWLKCDGQILSQVTYPTAFSMVGLIKDGGTVYTTRVLTTAAQINMQGVASDGTTVVGVCSNGAIYTKTSGAWTLQTSGIATTLNSVCFGNGVLVTSGASAVIRTSTDGTTWTGRTSNGSGTLTKVRYMNSLYIYCGNANYGYSSDGTTWTNKATNLTVGAIMYNSGLYTLFGNSGGYQTSTDISDVTLAISRRFNSLNNVAESFYDSTLGKYIIFSVNGLVLLTTDPTDNTKWETYFSGSQQFLCGCVSSTLVVAGGNFSVASDAPIGAYSYNSSTQFALPTIQSSVTQAFNQKVSAYMKVL